MSKVTAPVTGTVWKIQVKVGDAVAEGQALVILESMKMEMPVEAPGAGKVEPKSTWRKAKRSRKAMFSSRSTSRKPLRFGAMVPAGRAWLLWGVGLVALGAGCAGKQTGGEMGEDCYRDEDCKVGLVCVATPAPSGPRVCSNDVTGLASSVPAPPPDAGTVVNDAAPPGVGGSP